MVELDVQLSKDMVPVIYHDLFINIAMKKVIEGCKCGGRRGARESRLNHCLPSSSLPLVLRPPSADDAWHRNALSKNTNSSRFQSETCPWNSCTD